MEGATEIIYRTLEKTGLVHDEGPDKDGGYGPYVQSERMKTGIYMKYAKELIDTHQYLMYEISDMLGFDNPYYFSKVFKKVTGISPREHENRTPAS